MNKLYSIIDETGFLYKDLPQGKAITAYSVLTNTMPDADGDPDVLLVQEEAKKKYQKETKGAVHLIRVIASHEPKT